MKSDDVIGRVKTYEAIIKGENIPEPGIPESVSYTHLDVYKRQEESNKKNCSRDPYSCCILYYRSISRSPGGGGRALL